MISIIIVHYHALHVLLETIHSIYKSKPKTKIEIIVVDNDEKERIKKTLRNKFPKVLYIKANGNVGFGAGNNIGTKQAKGKLLFFLNPDTKIFSGTIDNLSKYMQTHSKVGIVAPLLIDRDSKPFQLQGSDSLTPQSALFGLSFLNKLFPNNPISKKYFLKDWDKKKVRKVAVVPGSAFLIRKDVFKKVRGFDEQFFMYFEESDLCRRVIQFGYECWIIPSSKVFHLWKVSTKNSLQDIEQIFTKSRFYYFKKHFGLPSALLVQLVLSLNKTTLLVCSILAISAFLRLYRISDFMMFIGDFARDYLAARDMILTGNIPLVGIPSSVVWLRQGPLSIYFIGLSFLLSNFNIIAPAVLYGILSVITTLLVYLIGKKFITKSIGLLASIFYATSPLVIINARMPYHTSSIPFFACLFFIFLYKFLEGERKYAFILFFTFGLLLQVELSNGVLFFMLFILWYIYKPTVEKEVIIKSIAGFLLGILPFILYDITHHFIQTVGFPLWVINRIRLFLGLTISRHPTTSQVPNAFRTIIDQITGIVFPNSYAIVAILVILLVVVLLIRRKTYLNVRKAKGTLLILFWVLIPLVGFSVHAAPGTAYFPLLFPPICILAAVTFYELIKKTNFALIIFVLMVFYNSILTVQNDFFLGTKNTVRVFPPGKYNFGITWKVYEEHANIILKDAKRERVKINAGGRISSVATAVDNYKYILWWKSRNNTSKNEVEYTIYSALDLLPKSKKLVYRDKYISLIKHEEKNE